MIALSPLGGRNSIDGSDSDGDVTPGTLGWRGTKRRTSSLSSGDGSVSNTMRRGRVARQQASLSSDENPSSNVMGTPASQSKNHFLAFPSDPYQTAPDDNSVTMASDNHGSPRNSGQHFSQYPSGQSTPAVRRSLSPSGRLASPRGRVQLFNPSKVKVVGTEQDLRSLVQSATDVDLDHFQSGIRGEIDIFSPVECLDQLYAQVKFPPKCVAHNCKGLVVYTFP